MFDALLRALSANPARSAPDFHLSVAILLLEAAYQDDVFDARERALIEGLLTKRFGLTSEECLALVTKAESVYATLVQLHQYTSKVANQTTPQQRIELIEMLWEVVYCDGVLDPEEDMVVRRIAGLIYVSDRDRVLARQRVLARKGVKGD